MAGNTGCCGGYPSLPFFSVVQITKFGTRQYGFAACGALCAGARSAAGGGGGAATSAAAAAIGRMAAALATRRPPLGMGRSSLLLLRQAGRRLQSTMPNLHAAGAAEVRQRHALAWQRAPLPACFTSTPLPLPQLPALPPAGPPALSPCANCPAPPRPCPPLPLTLHTAGLRPRCAHRRPEARPALAAGGLAGRVQRLGVCDGGGGRHHAAHALRPVHDHLEVHGGAPAQHAGGCGAWGVGAWGRMTAVATPGGGGSGCWRGRRAAAAPDRPPAPTHLCLPTALPACPPSCAPPPHPSPPSSRAPDTAMATARSPRRRSGRPSSLGTGPRPSTC